MFTKQSYARSWTAAIVAVSLLAAVIGCNEPLTTYQVSRSCLSSTDKVLVLPFMDTRSFVANNDPATESLGNTARDMFADALREDTDVRFAEVMTPDMPTPEKSMTMAEMAEIGRTHGADIVIAGQVFSYNETRAASIPPRAGMFVRAVRSSDASLLFVGDHYQSAAVPGAAGGREAQARIVARKLIESLSTNGQQDTALVPAVASPRALASMTLRRKARIASFDPMPVPDMPPEPLPDMTGPELSADQWSAQTAPGLPELGYDKSIFDMPDMADAVPLPPPPLDELGLTEEEMAQAPAAAAPEAEEPAAPQPAPEPELAAATEQLQEPEAESAPMEEPELAEADAPAELEAEYVAPDEIDLAAVDKTSPEFYRLWVNGIITSDGKTEVREDLEGTPARKEVIAPQPAADMDQAPESAPIDVAMVPTEAWNRTGDELASDLMASESALLAESYVRSRPALPPMKTEIRQAEVAAAQLPESQEDIFTVPDLESPAPAVAAAPVMEPSLPEGPVVSTPLVTEQPRSWRTVDNSLEDTDDIPLTAASMMSTGSANRPGAARILLLPYHDRENPQNLIQNTGGGEVVTALYGARLSMNPGIQVLWDASGQTSHDRLVDKDEALQLAKYAGADYVIRGQVVEFRRAQSVPSFYSAVISTAVLAAQLMFAEFSGVDVATEMYRVSDGECVMSRRDRAQQKYVVQAEKTVRKLADGMAKSIEGVIQTKPEDVERMDPLIDSLKPVTVLTNP